MFLPGRGLGVAAEAAVEAVVAALTVLHLPPLHRRRFAEGEDCDGRRQGGRRTAVGRQFRKGGERTSAIWNDENVLCSSRSQPMQVREGVQVCTTCLGTG